ncbi:hypothetical protein ISG33_02875 [Glaciecola sp. MH2013]|uniref:hypothetical protein n=1 Tax=Glaciecola sp. MH2013 TaxID=2785524 RepID=UPI00189DE36D|nr:hypothetical protein [Glaciecola sp. MH2013]MBF7072346.1 hypothetical protein [Glaciecola sp. MH2013]
MDYVFVVITSIFGLLLLISYLATNNIPLEKTKAFHWTVTWAVVLTLFAIFSAIFILVALFSVLTGEWSTLFLVTKIPVFIATLISYKAFSHFKDKFNKAK